MIDKADLKLFENYSREILVAEYNFFEFATLQPVTLQRLLSNADVLLGIFPKFSKQLFLYKTMNGRFCQRKIKSETFHSFEKYLPVRETNILVA